MTTNSEPTHGEVARAWKRFQSAAKVHTAAIQTLRLLTVLPDPQEHLAASSLVRLKADPRYSEIDRMESAASMLHIVQKEVDEDFPVLRESALVNVCASFEYLLKAFFVDGALQDEVAAAARIASLRVKVRAEEVLGTPRPEVWFEIADQAFKVVGQDTTMSARTRRFLLEHTYLGEWDRKDIEKAFDELDAKTFNEAFLVRNCVVHNGGRNSAVLARVNGSSAGAEIRFEGGFVTRLITPIKKIAAHLSPERL